MSLEPYWGEFLVSPIPLEMSLHWCTHACAVCFANLGKPGRRANVTAISNLLAQHGERSTPAAMLLRQGYPVLLSNKVDPFAASNYQVALPLIAAMAEMGIPIAFQTRGGQGIDEALAMVPRSCWYVSISQNDDALRKKLEPGAPDLESRYRLIEKLTAAGHHVSLGLNPVVPEWLPDPRAVLQRAKDCGATGAWIETLHLNPKQVSNMPPRSRAAVGEELIARAQKRRPSPLDIEAKTIARAEAVDMGLEVFSVGQPNASEYFAPYREVYAKTFPVLQDFINACHDEQPQAVIPFEEFWSFFDDLPEGLFNIGHYLGSKAHDLMKGVSNWMTYRQLVAMIYAEQKIPQCPVNTGTLAFAAFAVPGGFIDFWERLVDEHELPYLVWTPGPENWGDELEVHCEVDADGRIKVAPGHVQERALVPAQEVHAARSRSVRPSAPSPVGADTGAEVRSAPTPAKSEVTR